MEQVVILFASIYSSGAASPKILGGANLLTSSEHQCFTIR